MGEGSQSESGGAFDVFPHLVAVVGDRNSVEEDGNSVETVLEEKGTGQGKKGDRGEKGRQEGEGEPVVIERCTINKGTKTRPTKILYTYQLCDEFPVWRHLLFGMDFAFSQYTDGLFLYHIYGIPRCRNVSLLVQIIFYHVNLVGQKAHH
jgi:hypothetical protein